MVTIGEHLLGRLPSPPDPRDYKLETFMSDDPLDKALANVLKSWVVTPSQKAFDRAVVAAIHNLKPQPAPTPTPTPTIASWWNAECVILDQGNTGHCVGFTGADLMQAMPFYDKVENQNGHDIYYQCKILDNEPNEENGSYVRTLMLALRDNGIIKTFAATTSVDTVKEFVTNPNGGPLAVGIGWTDSMFYPDSDGRVHPVGSDVGGHAISEVWYDADNDRHWFPNHWGLGWGVEGMFYLTSADLANRLEDDGECWAAVQIA